MGRLVLLYPRSTGSIERSIWIEFQYCPCPTLIDAIYDAQSKSE